MANDATILLGFKNSFPHTNFSVYATYHIQAFIREIYAYFFKFNKNYTIHFELSVLKFFEKDCNYYSKLLFTVLLHSVYKSGP
jgi:hypothetical protein